MPVNDAFHIYDTTLRDGAQQEGLNLSVYEQIQKTLNFLHSLRKN